MLYTYQYEDTICTISLQPQADGTYKALIGEAELQVRVIQQAGDAVILEWTATDGQPQRARVHTAHAGDQRYAHVDGVAYTLTVPDARSRRRGGAAAAGDLTAQMPGQVVEVLVTAGDTVTAGQALVILEAMKMEIRVTAPVDGVVAAVMVAAGDVVERGQSLVEVTAADEA